MLNLEIEDLNVNLKYLRRDIKNIEAKIVECFPQEIITTFFYFNEHKIKSFNYR